MKVLYVEDDPAALQYVEKGLARRRFVVDVARSVAEGLERATSADYDALIIDVMLPDGEGFGLLQKLRGTGVETPALFLSARGEVEDRIRGLEIGADDYLPKPFALSELVARIRAITRRRPELSAHDVLRVADLVMDVAAGRVERAGRSLELSPKPYALLELLLRNAGRVVSYGTILEKVWGYDADLRSNAIAVQVNYLRKCVDRDFEPKLIHTRPGVGYVLEDRSAAPGPRD